MDIDKPEYSKGTYNQMKLAISERRDELERARYIGKQRISQTRGAIFGPEKVGRITQDMANGPTQATLRGLEKPINAWNIAVIQYINNYLRNTED